jgi:hypothetical protein
MLQTLFKPLQTLKNTLNVSKHLFSDFVFDGLAVGANVLKLVLTFYVPRPDSLAV